MSALFSLLRPSTLCEPVDDYREKMGASRTMGTAGPAAGPPHPRRKLRKTHLDPTLPRLRFLGIENPADPLVACERRDIFPNDVRRGRVHKRFPPIRRHAMHYTISGSFFGLTHNFSVLTFYSLSHPRYHQSPRGARGVALRGYHPLRHRSP